MPTRFPPAGQWTDRCKSGEYLLHSCKDCVRIGQPSGPRASEKMDPKSFFHILGQKQTEKACKAIVSNGLRVRDRERTATGQLPDKLLETALGKLTQIKHFLVVKLRAAVFERFFVRFGTCLAIVTHVCAVSAQSTAPGGPGKDAQWAAAGKQAVATAANLESKVWFTLAQGVMTEAYYPNVTVANVRVLQFVVVNRKTTKVETEQDDCKSVTASVPVGREEKILHLPSVTKAVKVPLSEFYRNVSFPGTLRFRQQSIATSGNWAITKHFITDPSSNTALFSVSFRTSDPDNELYVYYDPSLANSGMHDTAWTEGRHLLSQDGEISSALTCGRCRMSETVNGFFGVNDGLTQLRTDGKITQAFSKAENGNVVQVARIERVTIHGGDMLFALSFAKSPADAARDATAALTKGWEKIYQDYQSGWVNYLKTLPAVDPKYQAQFNMAAMQLKAHEDKTHRGANIASLSVPWGGGENANENTVGGYHLVWSRDLYQVFTAYLALGDKAAAERALDFLFKVQQRPDGSFPQNSWLDGRPFWTSLQMDEVAYPLIMAWQLGRFDKETYANHVKKSADFTVKNGPATPQERWEEEGGYSPSTIAAEIAGLVCAADIAKRNGDGGSANLYLKTADEWEANIEKWTATKTGKYGDGNYYLRITQKGKPDAGDKIELNNGGGVHDERDIVDAGFLELVRLGIRRADDPLIAKSVKVVDQVIKVDTPNGPGFYRYNHDGYGEMDDGRRWNWDAKYTGKGRLWALLSGERGQYELAACTAIARNYDYRCNAGYSRLNDMLGFANEGLMIPEQIWDKKEVPTKFDRQFVPDIKFGEGTGSATPLAWSMAQFIRLAVNLKAGRNLDTPSIVYKRYAAK
jgi:glucoamylase